MSEEFCVRSVIVIRATNTLTLLQVCANVCPFLSLLHTVITLSVSRKYTHTLTRNRKKCRLNFIIKLRIWISNKMTKRNSTSLREIWNVFENRKIAGTQTNVRVFECLGVRVTFFAVFSSTRWLPTQHNRHSHIVLICVMAICCPLYWIKCDEDVESIDAFSGLNHIYTRTNLCIPVFMSYFGWLPVLIFQFRFI